MSASTDATTDPTAAALIQLVADTCNQVRIELATVDRAHADANLAELWRVLRRQVAFIEAMRQGLDQYPTVEE